MGNRETAISLNGKLLLPNGSLEVECYASYIRNCVLPYFKQMLQCPLKDIKMQGGVRSALFENTEATWQTVGLNGNRAMHIHCRQYGIVPDLKYRSDNLALSNATNLMLSCLDERGCDVVLNRAVSDNTRNPLNTLMEECNSLSIDEVHMLQQELFYDDVNRLSLLERFSVQVYNSNLKILATAYEEMIQPKGIPLWATNWN